MAQPAILYIASHWPGGSAYGAQQRVRHLARFLQRLGAVRMIVVGNQGQESERRQSNRDFDILRAVDAHPAPSGLRSRFRHEIDPGYLQTDPFCISVSDRRFIEEHARKADLVWVHTVKTANLCRITRWPNSVLDVDDIPSRYYRSAASSSPTVIDRLKNHRMELIWQRREARLLQRFDALAVCSHEDRDCLGRGQRVHVLPNGFQLADPAPPRRAVEPPRLGFIGTFNWEANRQGVEWFVQLVWPLLREASPQVELRLVGQGSRQLAEVEGVDALGFVDDPAAEIATWTAMIVPLLRGGGTRIKIAEAFARGCPVVSTSLGAFGYDVESERELLLADHPQAFAAACLRLMEEPQLAERLRSRAQEAYLGNWTWEAQFSKLEQIVSEVRNHPSADGAEAKS